MRKAIFACFITAFIFSTAANAGKSWTYKGLNEPYGVATDSDGNIYVTCQYGDPEAVDANGYIIKLNSDGSVDTERFIGEVNNAGLNAPTGIAIVGDEIFVADINTVRIFSLKNGKNIGRVKMKEIFPKHIYGLSVGPDGSIYAADGPSNTIYKIDPKTKNAKIFIQGDYLGIPRAVVWNSARNAFLIAGWGSGKVTACDTNGQAVSIPGIFLSTLEGMVSDNSGNTYLASEALKSVYKLDSTMAVNSFLTEVGAAAGLALSSKNELIVVLPENESVASFTMK